MHKIKIATVCSGIGSPEFALNELANEQGFEVENVFACEIDKHARASYLANHKPNVMYEDMTSEYFHENAGYSHIFIGGIPCQAFSLAGKRLGELDPRGLLFFDFYRYVKNQQPKVFIIENVKGLLSDAGGKTFSNWLLLLGNSVNGHSQMFNHPDSLGYNLHHTVLNSKNFGVPQNRERVFIVGIRSDLPNDFRFPIGWKLDKRLKDVLETDVDEKYYLSDKMVELFTNNTIKHKLNGNGFAFKPQDGSLIAGTITTKAGNRIDDNYIQVKEATKQGFAIAEPLVVCFGRSEEEKKRRSEHFKKFGTDSGSFKDKTLILKQQPYYDTILANPNFQKEGLICEPTLKGIAVHPLSKKLEFNGFKDGNCPALLATDYKAPKCVQYSNSRIRRLTPLECWRLQGFSDEDFYTITECNNIVSKQGIFMYISRELNNELICKNVKLKTAIEKLKAKDIVLCTTKGIENMEMQTIFSHIPIEKTQNAKYKIAIDKLTVEGFAYHITTQTENTTTLYIKKCQKKKLQKKTLKKGEDLEQEVLKLTGMFIRITLDMNLKKENAFIISTVIPIIMNSITSICLSHKENTINAIISYSNLHQNLLEKELLVLKTDNILSISDSSLYKQAGNSITVSVMKEIIRNLLHLL